MERLKNCNQMPLTICEYLNILLNLIWHYVEF